MYKKISFYSTVLFMISLFSSPGMADGNVFYIVSNKADENTIVGYHQKPDGKYAILGEYNTGGMGTGDLEVPALQKDDTHPLLNGDDPLISAHSMAATKDKSFIIVVNPGDGTVSLMKVNKDFSLSSVNKVEATDRFPLSLAVHKNTVVVTSLSSDGRSGSVGVYKIKNGKLISAHQPKVVINSRPSTIAFSSNGKHVIVNELVTGMINVFSLKGDRLSAKPVSVIASPRTTDYRFQAIPVGFEVYKQGNTDIILMSEARFLTPDFKLRSGDGEVPLSPLYSWQTGSLSTYGLNSDGEISLISGDVLTGSGYDDGEIANCWVAVSKDGSTLWAANALSSSISSFDIDKKGKAKLRNEKAYKDKREKMFFSDLIVSKDGKHLYQLVGNQGKVMIFDINSIGDLTPFQVVGGLPELGTYGIVTF